ncbi:UvrD-helicase domain-containing protein [Bradyrhizobium brasilense]|uniref:UvrD-helicase domain-containing protein n=1 Tax=Bradyrhizobium brasilense TaxID=1419277 RepID=UPI0024B051F2|nr:UvrD-helicase domain-containing protein [Bradyrhizobium australafricanum]WFU31426.1 UvrD-helicase domain-containing protein [Bradyrhizobium australafricanum]
MGNDPGQGISSGSYIVTTGFPLLTTRSCVPPQVGLHNFQYLGEALVARQPPLVLLRNCRGKLSMETGFAGEIEVRVLRRGREVARVVRPLRTTPHGPVVRYKGRLWPLNGSSINLDGRTLEEIVADDRPAASGLPEPAPADDGLQDDVIGAAPDRRLLVDAGPGTGKTWVACQRVAHLIRGGIPPGRIWIVSFTRTAVHEIRNRLSGSLDEPSDAIAVRIATLDSHAWAMQSGFSSDAGLTGSFNDNIEATTAQIRGSEEVQDYLMQRVGHLVVDEAQDIVGARAELVETMIDALAPECGVTVFADRAQAIYGFTEDSTVAGDEGESSLLARLEDKGFKAAGLSRVHRTSEPGLLKIFTDVRRKVLDGKGSALKRRAAIGSEIERLAGRDAGAAKDIRLEGLSADTLVLLRRRSDVLMVSGLSSEAPHRLRMSGLPARVHPWIGEALWNFAGRRMTREEFAGRWSGQVRHAGGQDAEGAAWNLLLESAGESETVVDVDRLRTMLARSNPPSLFTSAEYGDAGPILGTIHASKGREADDVHLYLPPDDQEEDEDSDLDEEIRVMFVGATRARNRLFVGRSSSRGAGNLNGRVWRKMPRNGLQFEVGRAGDLDASSLVGRAVFASEEDALAAQARLRKTPVMTEMYAHAVRELDYRYALRTADRERVCFLSRHFKDDLYSVAKSCGRRAEPGYLAYVRSIGIRTLAVEPDDPVLERLHEPWRSSGFMLAPMLAGFGTTKFRAGED